MSSRSWACGARGTPSSRAPPPPGADGTLAHLAITHDVTERKRAGDALRKSEELFRTAFEDTNVAMVLTDPECRSCASMRRSPACSATREQMMGMAMSQVTHPDDLAESLARRVPLESGEADYFQMEKRYLHKRLRLLGCGQRHRRPRRPRPCGTLRRTGTGRHRPQACGSGEREIRRASESTSPDRQDLDRGGRAGDDRRCGTAAVADSARGRSRRREPVRPGERRGRVARGGGSKPHSASSRAFVIPSGSWATWTHCAGESRNRSMSTRCRRVAKSMPCSPRASMRTSSCP